MQAIQISQRPATIQPSDRPSGYSTYPRATWTACGITTSPITTATTLHRFHQTLGTTPTPQQTTDGRIPSKNEKFTHNANSRVSHCSSDAPTHRPNISQPFQTCNSLPRTQSTRFIHNSASSAAAGMQTQATVNRVSFSTQRWYCQHHLQPCQGHSTVNIR